MMIKNILPLAKRRGCWYIYPVRQAVDRRPSVKQDQVTAGKNAPSFLGLLEK
jgi:hypothetical protein